MPGDMVNMKKKRTFVDNLGAVNTEAGDEYPYGLKIRLEREQLMALGISMDSLPQIDEQMMIIAVAKVESVSKDGPEEQKEISIGLQITDMNLKRKEEDQEEEKKPESAKVSKVEEGIFG